MNIAIIVHGGAGAWDMDSERLQKGKAACRRAAQAGQTVLLEGGSALDAVETAVRVLEDSPYLDAGRGSYLNTAGEIEMDALIMDGRSLNLGAVGAVQLIQNPISLARRVMADSPHSFLVGRGAEAFAERLGIPRCTLADLVARESMDALDIASQDRLTAVTGDTVGAAALDLNGDLAAATSTGGTRRKLPGRVGDSPLVGAGGYADNHSAAISATGHGEALMKVLICKTAADFVSQGLSAASACQTAVRLLEERVEGLGGLIAVDYQGRVGFAYNTAAMPYAYALGKEDVVGGH
jgi:L-asparaginase / beta-aspartyl-peptidase